jgi:hypothetical protein
MPRNVAAGPARPFALIPGVGPSETPDRWARYGAAAGAIAIVLFVAGALVEPAGPDFGAPASEAAAFFDEGRTRLQVASALFAAVAPFLVWFLATVASLARAHGPAAARAGAVAYGCGLVFTALFLADCTAQAVGALRPENMADAPELAAALVDFELLAMGMAALAGAAILLAFAVLSLRDGAIWPRWLGWLALVAAPAYALRIGTLFTTEGAFAADGVLGLYVPVSAIAAWIFVASVVLTLELRRAPGPSVQ